MHWEKEKSTMLLLDTILKRRAKYPGVATFKLVAASFVDIAVINVAMIYKLLRQ